MCVARVVPRVMIGVYLFYSSIKKVEGGMTLSTTLDEAHNDVIITVYFILWAHNGVILG